MKPTFYVGKHPSKMSPGWAKDSLPAAIEHARAELERTGEEQTIVKVIRVVRRPARIVVENL